MKLFKHSKFEVSSKSLKERFGRVACVIFILLVSLSFTGCNTATTKVASLEWRVIAEIQQLKPCDESGWEVPEGAIVYKEKEEIKSYKIVGYETKHRVEEYQELINRKKKTKKGDPERIDINKKINSIKSPDSIIDKSTIEALAIKLLLEEVFLPEYSLCLM